MTRAILLVSSLLIAALAAPALASDPHPRNVAEQKQEKLDPKSLAEGEGRHPYGLWRDLERPRRDTAVNALDSQKRVDSVGREVAPQR